VLMAIGGLFSAAATAGAAYMRGGCTPYRGNLVGASSPGFIVHAWRMAVDHGTMAWTHPTTSIKATPLASTTHINPRNISCM